MSDFDTAMEVLDFVNNMGQRGQLTALMLLHYAEEIYSAGMRAAGATRNDAKKKSHKFFVYTMRMLGDLVKKGHYPEVGITISLDDAPVFAEDLK